MPRPVKTLILTAVWMLLAATTVLAAPGNITIKGNVVDPDGKPVAGVLLQIVPHILNGGWDTLNNFYKIPNYDYHRTTTDQNGEFVMRNVVDYPENYTHRYVINAPNGYNGLSIRALVKLYAERPDVTITIPAEYATTLVVNLKDRDGKPFSGTKVIFVQNGRAVGDPRKGSSYIIEAEFRDGIYKRFVTVKPDGYGRVAVLNFDTVQHAEATLLAKGLKINESLDGLAYVLKDATGRPVSGETTLLPGKEVHIEVQLP